MKNIIKDKDFDSINKSGNLLVKDIFCSRSRDLFRKKIVICITGSVADV